MPFLKKNDLELIAVHSAFALVCILVLLLPVNLTIGVRILSLVILYNLLLPFMAILRNHPEWLDLWLFLVPLSVFQIFPDWFLSDALGVITFPDTGAPRMGPIPIFMAGMWIIPLFIIVWIGIRLEQQRASGSANLAVAVVTAILFFGAEATLWRIPIWQAQAVTTIFHIGIYLMIPEILLGVHTFWAYKWSVNRSRWQKVWAAFLVMLLYIGALSFFYLIVEKILLGT